jgi:hypothetical protein
MRPTLAQHQAIEARMNMIFGVKEYDRLFLSIDFCLSLLPGGKVTFPHRQHQCFCQ